jgi:hypothetical protein
MEPLLHRHPLQLIDMDLSGMLLKRQFLCPEPCPIRAHSRSPWSVHLSTSWSYVESCRTRYANNTHSDKHVHIAAEHWCQYLFVSMLLFQKCGLQQEVDSKIHRMLVECSNHAASLEILHKLKPSHVPKTSLKCPSIPALLHHTCMILGGQS